MTCGPFDSVLTLDDGTLSLEIHGQASVSGSLAQTDEATGTGVIVYADGSAKRWLRFEARVWGFAFSGQAPSGIWDLDLSVDTWAAAFADPENIGSTLNVNVVPARPTSSAKDYNSAIRSWSLTLREAVAR